MGGHRLRQRREPRRGAEPRQRPRQAPCRLRRGRREVLLGPVEVKGQNITDANAGLEVTSSGQVTNQWQINLTFDGTGTTDFATISARMATQPADPPRNQFAIVLDDLVVSAPGVNERDPRRTGADHRQLHPGRSGQTWPTVLKFGALPITFDIAERNTISADPGRGPAPGRPAGRRCSGCCWSWSTRCCYYRALALVSGGQPVGRRALDLRRRDAARQTTGLHPDPARCRRPDRGDRHHCGLVHRLLRTNDVTKCARAEV